MSDSDFHWSNSMEIDGEALNLWSVRSDAHCSCLSFKGCSLGCWAQRGSLPLTEHHLPMWDIFIKHQSRGLVFVLSGIANRWS